MEDRQRERTIAELIADSATTITSLIPQAAIIDEMAALMIGTLRSGGKIMTAGNGGSAAEAMHMAEELLGHYKLDRASLAALSLSSDAAALTCIANDYGFDAVFSRQIEGLGRAGDVLALFSSSGRSENVCRAAQTARKLGVHVVALLGQGGGRLRELSDLCIVVDSDATERIQEAHQVVLHIMVGKIEDAFVQTEARTFT